jgi:alkanesulfonate monooxygenase SsuD/methylene tetrahydromethanopterin reductase-like flavin-dependent oxidoreductase (luciferase family)
MISRFMTVYPGHIDMPDLGQHATPADERNFDDRALASVFGKLEAIARQMDRFGWDTLWLAEHHFQREGYEVLPNVLMLAVHLAHLTERLKIGCGFNITPMWHPLRLAEDYAVADILTKGRTVFGVGRGYHTREVETFGSPLLDQDANRALFEEQVEILFKAFESDRFAHRGKHYTLPPSVPYRGYPLTDLTLVPRPLNRPVECWQPIVSASPRALDFMVRHGIKGLVGGGAATMAEGPIAAYRDAAARAGKQWELGENLGIGIFFHLARTREQAVREMTPWYEEHVKMFAPLGFVPGITPEQVKAVARRGGWAEAGVPTLEHFMRTGAWFAGTAADLVEHLKKLEARFPGLEHINLSTSLCTPQQAMLEQFQWVAEEVMPAFKGARAMAAQ